MTKKAAFKVVLYYVTPPTAEQLQGIWNFVLGKYVTEDRKAEDIEFSVEEDLQAETSERAAEAGIL